MILQTWKMAWHGINANKMRTFLTMLGIVIGVTALIVLVSIADGATSSVTDRISDMGTDYLSVQISDDKENPLRVSEFNELFDDEKIGEVSPMGSSSVTGKSGYTSGSVNIYGVTGGYFRMMDMELVSGRFLKQTDVDNHSYVIVLTSDTAVEFFGREDVAGETLTLDGKRFMVAGVLSEDSASGLFGAISGSDEENVTLEGYIPFTTLTRLSDSILAVTRFYVAPAETVTVEETEHVLTQIMTERLDNDEEAFTIMSMSEIQETMEEVTDTLALMLGGIAAISLLVGGIGIMNIMLVSVTERTREIGIRKAIGASQGSIMIQFLMEAMIVSLAGCIAGIGVSWAVLQAAGQFMGESMSFRMNPTVALIAVLFSVLIGMIFGIYPARKAAKKRPIDALRYSQ